MDDIITAPEAPGLDVPTGADDGGVADAAAALEHQVANPGSADPAPTAATAGRGTPPPPQAAPRPSWQEGNRKAQESFARRQQAIRRDATQARAEKDRYEAQLRQNNEVFQQLLGHLQGKQTEIEPMPDPNLDPQAFAVWQQKLIRDAVQQQIAPLAQTAEQQRQQWAAAEQQRLQQSQQTEAQRAETDKYIEYEAAYMEAAPEIAYGVRERVETVRTMVRGAFEDLGDTPEQAERMSGMLMLAVGRAAEAAGRNPVAEMDAWGTSLVTRLLRGAGIDVEPVGMGEPLDWQAPASSGTGYDGGYQPQQPVQHAPAAPQQPTEAQRLAAVRQRAGSVGNAGPRAPSRVQTTRSETMDLFRAGVNDVNQLYQAALREAGGNKLKASQILGALA